MKLRCTADHIRLRLRKSDLATLQKEGIISVRVSLGTHALIYSLRVDSSSIMAASLSDGHLIISLPQSLFTSWADSDQVGIEHIISYPEGSTLGLLIEKDFPCLDRENEDKSDTFFELVDQDNPIC